VGGQAVEDEGIRRGEGEQVAVELVRLEVVQPLFALVLLAHADPGVRDDGVGAGDRFARVAHHLQTQ
jgi:hypothetical protein